MSNEQWHTGAPPPDVSLWVTIRDVNGALEVAVAKARLGYGDAVAWYSNGFIVMRDVIAWMPMQMPEPFTP